MILNYNNFINESKNIRIPKISIDNIFFHGTTTQSDGVFLDINYDNSDWDAIWVADDENIAEEFSEDKKYDDDDILTVYKIKIKTKKIADIDFELSKRLSNYYELDDFRDMIDILKSKGFDGWKVNGSIGSKLYNDYAIFYSDLIEIGGVKFFIDNQWTEYFQLNDANEYLKANTKLEIE